MTYDIVDPASFLSEGVFTEDKFKSAIDSHDWSVYENRKVLVRGCNAAVMPPWAFMMITARLAGIARSVRYGNEHDNIVVYRTERQPKE
jgi:hypothetical protein